MAPWLGSADRVPRGGSYDYPASCARSAYRINASPVTRTYNLGLRPSQGISQAH